MSNAFLERLRRQLRVRSDLLRCAFSEWFATALYVWTGTSAVAQATLSRGRASDHASVAIGWGAAAALATLIAHRTSGAHLNPAISLFRLSTQQISAVRFFVYVGAQVFGSFFGAALTYAVYYDAIGAHEAANGRTVNGPTSTAHIFASYPAGPHMSLWAVTMEQVLGAAALAAFLAALSDRRTQIPACAQPALVGTAYALLAVAFGWQSDAAPPNPAHDAGARLFSALYAGYGLRTITQRNFVWFVMPVVAPLAGALFGGWAYLLAVGLHAPSEIDDLTERVHRLHNRNDGELGYSIDEINETTHPTTKPVIGWSLGNNKNNDNCNSKVNGNNNSSYDRNDNDTVVMARKVQNDNKINDNNNDNKTDNDDKKEKRKSSSESNSSRVPRTISANRVALADPPDNATRWHYNDLFADGNYVDLSAEQGPLV